MHLFHGTSFDNATSILFHRQLKGKKAYNKHKNRYASLSKSRLVARQFGEVVFRFDQIPKAIPVEYNNMEWILNNQEIVEYVMKHSNHEVGSDYTESLKKMSNEREVIVKNKYNFDECPVIIYLIHHDLQEMNEMKEELLQFIEPQDRIMRSRAMYEEFMEWV